MLSSCPPGSRTDARQTLSEECAAALKEPASWLPASPWLLQDPPIVNASQTGPGSSTVSRASSGGRLINSPTFIWPSCGVRNSSLSSSADDPGRDSSSFGSGVEGTLPREAPLPPLCLGETSLSLFTKSLGILLSKLVGDNRSVMDFLSVEHFRMASSSPPKEALLLLFPKEALLLLFLENSLSLRRPERVIDTSVAPSIQAHASCRERRLTKAFPWAGVAGSTGVRWVDGSRSMSRFLFSSSCMALESMSLASKPNGFSISVAMLLRLQTTKTCMKVKMKAPSGLDTHCEMTMGVTSQCINSKVSHVWA
mmetsp:Transcript_19564/g.61455  ORF Transcript_19564/g.61455 Transcript_19564/m.61455 type:complete len:310 (+) Transcript_19564:329-1258(+)